jgi:hypothetical protein
MAVMTFGDIHCITKRQGCNYFILRREMGEKW